MTTIEDWNGKPIAVARSCRGVTAVLNPWDNVIRIPFPWPPPELVQKLYKSNRSSAFDEDGRSQIASVHGYYSDLQSVHSEDTLTWSCFGTLAYATPAARKKFVASLLRYIKVDDDVESAVVWLWRRVPHPDTLVSGGPEIDFGIQTTKTFILGEAKWRSRVAANQGKGKNRTQIELRNLFCSIYGSLVYRDVRCFCVLALSPDGGLVAETGVRVKNVSLRTIDLRWEELIGLGCHPAQVELKRYLDWKASLSLP